MINKCQLMNWRFFSQKRKEIVEERNRSDYRQCTLTKNEEKEDKLITENSILIDVKILFYCLSGSLICRARSFNIPKARIRFRPNNFAKVSSQLTYCLLTGSNKLCSRK